MAWRPLAWCAGAALLLRCDKIGSLGFGLRAGPMAISRPTMPAHAGGILSYCHASLGAPKAAFPTLFRFGTGAMPVGVFCRQKTVSND